LQSIRSTKCSLGVLITCTASNFYRFFKFNKFMLFSWIIIFRKKRY